MAGGSSKSNTSQQSSVADNRQVITTTSYDLSDHSTNAYDLSNKSQTNSNNTTSLFDASSNTSNSNNATNSNNTTNLYDSSSKTTTTTTNNYTTDQGAVAGGLALAGKAVQTVADNAATGYHFADGIFDSALHFANDNDARLVTAFDHAAAVSDSAIKQLQSAYADAQGTTSSQKQIILGVLAVAALIALRR
jgi:hypothetical protein